jgi:hypothetical protein
VREPGVLPGQLDHSVLLAASTDVRAVTVQPGLRYAEPTDAAAVAAFWRCKVPL